MIRTALQISSTAFPGSGPADPAARLAEIAQAAEEAGVDAITVSDHLVQLRSLSPSTDRTLDAYTVLGNLAARTSRVLLGTLASPVTLRHAAVLANAVMTLHALSRGRALLSIGAGNSADDCLPFGIPFPSKGERLNRLEETVQVCRLLFTHDSPTFEGRYYNLHEPPSGCRSINDRSPLVFVAGGGKRTLRLAAQYADGCNFPGGHEDLVQGMGDLIAACNECGRDPDSIMKTRIVHVLLASTNSKARARYRELEACNPVVKNLLPSIYVGDPETIAHQLAESGQLGITGIFMNALPTWDSGNVSLLPELMGSLREVNWQ